MVSRASVRASAASRSSTSWKCGESAASSGKRRSSDWQKAWIVPMRMPPGRSSTRANSARARWRQVRRGVDCQRAQCVVQPCVVQRYPSAEGALQPHRHLRRGGLGEGQALDAFGFFAREHQPQQAVGQQLGLARPGRCRDERRHGGVGRRQLLAVGAVARSRTPPPLEGGGWGEGSVGATLRPTPPPTPSLEGRGSLGFPELIPPLPPLPIPPRGPTARSRRSAARGPDAAATDSSDPAGRRRRSARPGCLGAAATAAAIAAASPLNSERASPGS